MFFIGITIGRALNGFLAMKLSDTQMVRMGQGIIAIGIAAFLLPLAIGACEAVGGNIATDAFGTVAMVAMTPLIAIQVLGGLSEIRRQRTMRETVTATARVRETVIRL